MTNDDRKARIIELAAEIEALAEDLDAPEMAPPTDRVPMQPVILRDRVIRFRENALVRYLLDNGGVSLNRLAELPNIPREDWAQFAQLIGYSVSGYCDLSYALETDTAQAAAERVWANNPEGRS